MDLTMSDVCLQVSSRILHHVPTSADYQAYELQFSSRYITDKVVDAVMNAKVSELHLFLDGLDPSIWTSVKGLVLENLAVLKSRRRLDHSSSGDRAEQ